MSIGPTTTLHAFPEPVEGTEIAAERETEADAKRDKAAATPPSDPDAWAATEVIDRYYTALEQLDGAEACRVLTPESRRAVAQNAASIGAKPTCEAGLTMVASAFAGGAAGDAPRVVWVKVKGDEANARVEREPGDVDVTGDQCIDAELVRTADGWRVAGGGWRMIIKLA